MRLHHLEATAFGPFADTVRVDFDALSDAGLFLLSGPTGAGKSSVLDAVCFALYGDVPGDRASAKRLRCDLADEGVPPRVVLEVTLSGRRFRIDRSPAWVRAKRRGTGTTTEQARVVISERVEGGAESEWRPLSTRLDETGHLVTQLVGMNLPQFCQVALLPQGQFQTFLRAGSQERHALLQQLFHTDRFDRIEGWLRQHRIDLRRASSSHQEQVADRVSRLCEVTSTQAPADWPDEPSPLDAWAQALLEQTRDHVASAATRLVDAQAAEARAGAAEAEGRAVADAIATRKAALDELARLDEGAGERDCWAERVSMARRADRVQPLHRVAQLAQARVTEHSRAWVAAREALAALTGTHIDDEAGLVALRRAALAGVSEADRLMPVQTRCTELALARSLAEDALSATHERMDSLRSLGATQRDSLATLREHVTTVSISAGRREALADHVATLQARAQAAALVLTLSEEVAVAAAEHDAGVRELQAAKETWLDVRERRLEGMAAEIASALVVGGCCPVCGSQEHPSPAAAGHGVPTGDDERASRKLVDDLEIALEARAQLLRDREARLAAARGAAGDPSASLPEALAEAQAALEQATADADALDALTQEVTALEQQAAETDAALGKLSDRVSHEHTAALRAQAELDASLAEVAALLDGTPFDDLGELRDHHAAVEDATGCAVEALRHHHEAVRAHEESLSQAVHAALEAGFDSLDDATTAWLEPQEQADLTERITTHDQARTHVLARLASEAVQSVAHAVEPDMAALTRDHAAAREQALQAHRAHHLLSERVERVEDLAAGLAHDLRRWIPLRKDLDLATSLAAFVEGKSPDNQLQMRLSAYVLAHRLSQVVEAANLRLVSMSDQRYSLLHTGQRGAGERRGGLSLLVRDDWSGELRDPATLSGGETFVVSLALALGLSDVITAEAGGSDLGTLFVDEGFGSLDADTLDDVMDTLDSLRDGGRVVGVVSHVAEMQTRIPTQLRVHKARQGSRLTQ